MSVHECLFLFLFCLFGDIIGFDFFSGSLTGNGLTGN